jgi:hypothetical protein
MKSLTITINDNLYRQARIWAARRNKTVSFLVMSILEDLPGCLRWLDPSTAPKPAQAEPTAPKSALIWRTMAPSYAYIWQVHKPHKHLK